MNPTMTEQQVQPHMIPYAMHVTPASLNTNKMEQYKNLMFILGIAEIVLAGICIIFDIAVLSIWGDIGQGIWCGSVLLACGIVGVLTKPTQRMYIANMVMTIISAYSMCVLFSLSILCAIVSGLPAAKGLQSAIAVASFAALVINIVRSVYCCVSVCDTATPAHMIMPTQHQNWQTALQPQPMPTVTLGVSNPIMTLKPEVHPQPGSTV